MARKGNDNNKKVGIEVLAGVIIVAVILLIGNFSDSALIQSLLEELEINSLENVEQTNPIAPVNSIAQVNGNLVIDYIDVGQGDSILIRQGDAAMLIDGGTSECKDTLLSFLQSEGIDRFEYIIGTHAHEDHIGSLDDVANAYDFDTFLFPKSTTTTKNFENLVLAVQSKGKKFTTPEVGKTYELGDAVFQILAPNSESYSSLNNYSIVVKLTYGQNTFLFTGDAESISETEMLDRGIDVSADVLKIGHHGSTTSTSKKFLDAVNPKYAVISCGQNNTYKHPTRTTMSKLENAGIPVYRTDESGTIECISDGTTIIFNVEPGTYSYLGG